MIYLSHAHTAAILFKEKTRWKTRPRPIMEPSMPQEYPNSCPTWWVVFCGLDLYGWDMSTIHATLTPGGDWEINVEHSWRNPPQNLFGSNSHLPKKQQENCLGSTLKNLLGGESHLSYEEPKKTNVSFCPKTFPTAEDPKVNAVGGKCKKELRNWAGRQV